MLVSERQEVQEVPRERTLKIRRYDVPCAPPLWARGGHAQTFLGHMLPSPGPHVEALDGALRIEIDLRDGD